MSVEGRGRCWLVGGERPRTRVSQRTRGRMCSLNVNVRFMASEGPFEDRAGCGRVAPSVALRSVAIGSFLHTKISFIKKTSIHRPICLPPAIGNRRQCKPRRPHLAALPWRYICYDISRLAALCSLFGHGGSSFFFSCGTARKNNSTDDEK